MDELRRLRAGKDTAAQQAFNSALRTDLQDRRAGWNFSGHAAHNPYSSVFSAAFFMLMAETEKGIGAFREELESAQIDRSEAHARGFIRAHAADLEAAVRKLRPPSSGL